MRLVLRLLVLVFLAYGLYRKFKTEKSKIKPKVIDPDTFSEEKFEIKGLDWPGIKNFVRTKNIENTKLTLAVNLISKLEKKEGNLFKILWHAPEQTLCYYWLFSNFGTENDKETITEIFKSINSEAFKSYKANKTIPEYEDLVLSGELSSSNFENLKANYNQNTFLENVKNIYS